MEQWTKTGVECYAGYRGDETPRCIRWKGRSIAVLKILTQWMEPEYRYFRVNGEDQVIYTLRQDVNSALWEVIQEIPPKTEPRARK
ncbi:MAG: hypothetical protein ACQEQ7_13625 [Thermodesulfobacteriota bacterium]